MTGVPHPQGIAVFVATVLLLTAVPIDPGRAFSPTLAPRPSFLHRLGRTFRRRLGAAPGTPADDRLWGASVVMLVSVVIHPAAPVLGLLWLWGRHVADRRRGRIVSEASGWSAAPEAASVMALAVRSGANVYQAIDVVALRVPGVGGRAFREVSRRVGMGVLLDQAVDELVAQLGESGEPIARVVRRCTATGAALAPALERTASELRSQQHQRQLEAARRLPVLLLFPLVTCTLPAFALLTVVPLLVSSLAQLSG